MPQHAETRQTTLDTAAPVEVTTPAVIDTRPPHLAAVADALTPAEVAELLRVDVYTVRRWINRGDLGAYRIGRRLLVARTTLDLFVQRQLVRE